MLALAETFGAQKGSWWNSLCSRETLEPVEGLQWLPTRPFQPVVKTPYGLKKNRTIGSRTPGGSPLLSGFWMNPEEGSWWNFCLPLMRNPWNIIGLFGWCFIGSGWTPCLDPTIWRNKRGGTFMCHKGAFDILKAWTRLHLSRGQSDFSDNVWKFHSYLSFLFAQVVSQKLIQPDRRWFVALPPWVEKRAHADSDVANDHVSSAVIRSHRRNPLLLLKQSPEKWDGIQT